MFTVVMPMADMRFEIDNCKLYFSLQFRADGKLLRRRIVLDTQHIRLAADLTVFNVTLTASRELVDSGDIPLATTRALKTSFHSVIIS